MWAREKLFTNNSNNISNSTFKAIYTCSTSLIYEKVYLVAISFYIFVCKMWAREKLFTNDSNNIWNSKFKAIYKCSTIICYEIGIFSRSIVLYNRMKHVSLWKFVHEWFKQYLKFNISSYLYMFYHSKLRNRLI